MRVSMPRANLMKHIGNQHANPRPPSTLAAPPAAEAHRGRLLRAGEPQQWQSAGHSRRFPHSGGRRRAAGRQQYRTVTHEEADRGCLRGPELQAPRSSRARIARVSVETASPAHRTRSVFPVVPRPTVWARTVAWPIQATRCGASWPVCKAAMPRCPTAGVNGCRHPILSSRVSRAGKSSMRFANVGCDRGTAVVCASCVQTCGIRLRWSGDCFRSASMHVRAPGERQEIYTLHQVENMKDLLQCLGGIFEATLVCPWAFT